MAPDVHIRDCLLDLRHMASHALASLTSRFVMCVLLDCWCIRTVGRAWAVAIEAQNAGRLSQYGIILCAMCVVASEAGDTVCVHQAAVAASVSARCFSATARLRASWLREVSRDTPARWLNSYAWT